MAFEVKGAGTSLLDRIIFALILLPCAMSVTTTTDSFDSSPKSLEPRDTLPFLGSNFLNLAFHASIIVNNTLYIDGGEIAWQGNGSPGEQIPMNSTLAINLSESWAPETVAIQSFSKDNGVPTFDFENLWAGSDGKSFYAYGGAPMFALKPFNPVNSLWQFSQGVWSSVGQNGNSFPSINRVAGGLGASGPGTGYVLGGFDSGTMPYWSEAGFTPVPGLLSYDMKSDTWTNVSASPFFSFDGTAINGAMEYVPDFGSDGLLITMGGEVGEIPGLPGWLDLGQNMLSFSNISIYDPSTDNWYWQTATGYTGPADIPTGASLFCHTGARSSESTYEIFVYGGHNDSLMNGDHNPTASEAATQKGFNQVYVLSLPSFVWFRVNDTSGPAKYGHTCENFGNGQMISVGGLDPTDTFSKTANVSDPFPQGLGIFNMVNLSWAEFYDANAGPYEAPDVVKEWYSRPNSNSSVQWISPQLKDLFLNPPSKCGYSNGPCPSPSVQPSPSETSAASSLETNSPQSSSQASYVGPVIGGVFGGLALISLVAVLAAWLVLRRRRNRRKLESPALAQLPDSLPEDYIPREKYHSASVQEVDLSKTADSERSERSDESHVVSPVTATTIGTNPPLPQFRQELGSESHPQELAGGTGVHKLGSDCKSSVSESPLSPISEGDSCYSKTLSGDFTFTN